MRRPADWRSKTSCGHVTQFPGTMPWALENGGERCGRSFGLALRSPCWARQLAEVMKAHRPTPEQAARMRGLAEPEARGSTAGLVGRVARAPAEREAQAQPVEAAGPAAREAATARGCSRASAGLVWSRSAAPSSRRAMTQPAASAASKVTRPYATRTTKLQRKLSLPARKPTARWSASARRWFSTRLATPQQRLPRKDRV